MLKKSMQKIRVAICQINPTVGDLKGNKEKIISYLFRAKELKASLGLFPELSLTGTPAKDLVFFPEFQMEVIRCLDEIRSNSFGIVAVVGSIGLEGSKIFNSAYVFSDGKTLGVYRKRFLKRKEEIDESRYFASGSEKLSIELGNMKARVLFGSELSDLEPCLNHDIYLILDSSVYFSGRIGEQKRDILGRIGEKLAVYCNLVGGQDEWVFYGGSFIAMMGRVVKRGRLFDEDIIVWDVFENEICGERDFQEIENILSALILATRDYVKKNGFRRVFLGISGGIDSSVTAYIACKAVGSENVTLIFMPTRFTSRESYEDSQSLSKNLKVELKEVSIEELYGHFASFFEKHMGDVREITLENIQPRIRSSILMAYANNFDGIVLATGNKSEIATGYFTIYGDGAGGFAPLRDIPKTLVYELAKHINSKEGFPLIPERVIKREPTAELKFGQKDIDALPPYEMLDMIVSERIEKVKDKSSSIDPFLEKLTLNRFFSNEYKRRQLPLGPIIFKNSFARNIDLPVTNKWRY